MLRYNTPPVGGGLYVIWLSDTHYYGGRAADFKKRWSAHLSYLRSGGHNNPWMQRIFVKYGRFEPSVVTRSDSETTRQELEQVWLDEHCGKPGCVNLNKLADGGFSGSIWVNDGTINRRILPIEVESLLAIGWVLGCVPHPEGWHRADYGLPKSEAFMEAAKLAGEKRQGQPRDPEAVAKTAAGNRGRKNTPEGLANLKAAGELRRGRKRDPEAVAASANANRGHQHTPEMIAKMARAKARLVGGVLPPEGICSSDFEVLLAFPRDGAIAVDVLRECLPQLSIGAMRTRLCRCKAAGLVESAAFGLYRLTPDTVQRMNALG